MSNDVSGNPQLLVWPTDETGFTGNLRVELARAASRVNGHPAKLAVLMATLRMAAQHAQARFRGQAEANQRMLESLAAQEQAEVEAEELVRAREVAKLQARIDHLQPKAPAESAE